MLKSPKHILVIRLSAMGDVAMMVPVLRALVDQNPSCQVTVLTRAFFRPFFKDLPNVTIYAPDLKGKHKGVIGLYRLAKELKTLKIDAVADLHNVLRSKILKTFLSRRPFVQIDKGRIEKQQLISGKSFNQLKSTHHRYVEVFKKLGIKVDLTLAKFPPPRRLSEKCKALLGDKTEKWIGVAPFAQYISKMYPLDLMQDVIHGLSDKKDSKILLFGGGEQEVKQLNTFEKDNVINISGKFSLDEELEIISNLDLMLSMDSANAHIAAMLGKKVITIWGVTHPYAGFYPFGQDENFALLADREKYPKIPTSVYGNKYPEHYKNAAGSISPNTIIAKVNTVK